MCSVDYPMKDYKEMKTSTLHTKQVPDCKKVTKNNCITDWEVDSNENKVWRGRRLVPQSPRRSVSFRYLTYSCLTRCGRGLRLAPL